MSSTEETDTHEEEGEEEPQKYTQALSALPPRVVQQEESQVEVSASPAFQCLDELFQEGKLTGTRLAHLKAKYTELHETVKTTRDNESNLLIQVKELQVELERQRVELEKADNLPDKTSNSEVINLRRDILKSVNAKDEILDREYQLNYKFETLTEEKKILEKEFARLPKQGETEKKIKELQAACDEIKKEIMQRQMENKSLKEDLESNNRQNIQDKKEYEKLIDEMEKLKGDLVQVNSVPNQLMKEKDKLQRQFNEIDKKQKTLDSEHETLKDSLKLFKKKKEDLTDEKFELETEVEKGKSLVDQKNTEVSMILKEIEAAKNEQATLEGDRGTIDMGLRHIMLEKKNQHETHARRTREKDRDLKTLKKAELQHKVAEENLLHTRSVNEKTKAQVESLPKDDGSLSKKKADLAKEVEMVKVSLAKHNKVTTDKHIALETSAAQEQALLYEQSDLRIEVVELNRLAAIKADEREQKARDFMRAEIRFHKAEEDLQTKDLQIADHKKKEKEMEMKLKEFAKLYDVIKNERNKCVNLIQTSTQKAAEMKEKIKMLQNEIEILRHTVNDKDKILQNQRLKHMTNIVKRDSLLNELSKQKAVYMEMKAQQDQQKMDMSKLNMMINQGEEESTRLRDMYSKELKKRNDRGLKLIQIEEEVATFYEKVNIEDQLIRNGNVELQSREEEIRFLNMQMTEDKRAIELLRKQVPQKQALEQEREILQMQLEQCQERMVELFKELEDPRNVDRVRYLEGKDPTPTELHEKTEGLEMRLAEKEEHLLEKDLIYEQVTRLAERVKKKAESGKEDTLELAKKVNDLQGKIKGTTRQMMAMVSELSMNQANALKLQQNLKEKEAELEQCYIRMEKGEPPNDDYERAWLRMLRDDDIRQRDKEEIRMAEEEEDQYKIAGGVTTTAEPRPNAYIPDDDSELPIPRPYGKHAPFKPSEPGSTMRHTRKPIPKPIEI